MAHLISTKSVGKWWFWFGAVFPKYCEFQFRLHNQCSLEYCHCRCVLVDCVVSVVLCMCAVPQVVHIAQHGGVAAQMPTHSQSGQQQQGGQQATSSGHQTPTPSQHTPYAVQQVGPGVGVMPSAAGTPPQPHLYHAMTQHPVITPQGPAPPSPQVVRRHLWC